VKPVLMLVPSEAAKARASAAEKLVPSEYVRPVLTP